MTGPPRPSRARFLELALRVAGSAGRWWPLLLIVVVAWLAGRELRHLDLDQVRLAMHGLSRFWLAVAAGLTVLNLALFGCYDLVSLEGSPVPRAARWRLGALAFAWSNFLTLGPIAGPAIRFWLYRPFGVDGAVLGAAIVCNVVAFGAALVVCSLAWLVPIPALAPLAAFVLAAGLAFLLGRLGRAARAPMWLRRGPRIWGALLAVALLDWLIAAAVFAAILRATGRVFDVRDVIRLFFTGQVIGAISLLPGGLGSADTFWLLRLPLDRPAVGAALLAYRALYYLLPWVLACLILLRLGARAGARWLKPVPSILALLIGGGAAVLLASTASPALAHRLRLLERFEPLGLVELSHAVAALTGLGLLFLARGVARGYREAHRMTVALLLVGGVVALLKGFDYEEALLLLALAGVTASQGSLFRKEGRAAWFGWTTIAIAALGVGLYAVIGFRSQFPTPYEPSLWYSFGYGAHADQVARFLRSFALLAASAAAFLLYVGLRVPAPFHPPTLSEIDRALRIQDAQGAGTSGLMVAAGDKSIFFWGDSGFVTYRVVGSYLVVFSDPTCRPGEERDCLEALMALAHEMDRRVVFYQVGPSWLPLLHDHGFSFFKLGEEGLVDLERFTLEGTRWKHFRNAVNRLEGREGYRFEVVPPARVESLLPALRRISDQWLTGKEAREKQFSIGAFSESYLSRFPCALVLDTAGEPVAFANVLAGPGRSELSIDLMRHADRAPDGIMDYLFVKLLLWGSEQRYATFNFGMAPLAKVGDISGARLWERLAHLVFRHGEGLYNFRGLRDYKAKFHPRWVPRYMAYPEFWEWPLAVAQVSVLIAGGWRSVLQPRRSAS